MLIDLRHLLADFRFQIRFLFCHLCSAIQNTTPSAVSTIPPPTTQPNFHLAGRAPRRPERYWLVAGGATGVAGPAEGDLRGMAKVKRGAGSGPNSLGCVMRSAMFELSK